MSMSTTATGPATSRSQAYRVLERIFDEGFGLPGPPLLPTGELLRIPA